VFRKLVWKLQPGAGKCSTGFFRSGFVNATPLSRYIWARRARLQVQTSIGQPALTACSTASAAPNVFRHLNLTPLPNSFVNQDHVLIVGKLVIREHIPQCRLLDLAGRGMGHIFDELNIIRDPPLGDLAIEKALELMGREVRAHIVAYDD